MKDVRFAVIADDLTGAADTGVQLARSGHRVAVFFRGEPVDGTGLDAVVLDTDSRSLAPGAARERVYEAGAAVRSAEIVYKKVDSTLRGNLGEEVEAALEATGREKAVISPAFPGEGRTTVGGVQLLHGTAVHRTELATDPRTPVRESHIPSLFHSSRSLTGLDTSKLEDDSLVRRALQGSRYLLADATEEAHLRMLVEAIPDPSEVLWVGSAGLARALGGVYPGGRGPESLQEPVDNALVVVGSLGRASREQLQALVEERGLSRVELRAAQGSPGGEPDVEAAIREARTALASALTSGESAVLCSAPQTGGIAPEKVAEVLAGVVVGLEPGAFGALVLTGGDTAAAVSLELGATGIELLGEVEAGVPVGRLLGPRPYPVVTKAGGFGGRDTLKDALKVLVRDSEER